MSASSRKHNKILLCAKISSSNHKDLTNYTVAHKIRFVPSFGLARANDRGQLAHEINMKVLFLAPQCDPVGVGEASSVFHLLRGLVQDIEATIIGMNPSGRSGELVKAFPEARVIELQPWPIQRISERFNALVKPSYIKFYFEARRIARELLSNEKFHLGHQIGPLALRYPSPLIDLGLPFVMGPLAGSLRTPKGFRENSGWYYRLRSLDTLRFRSDPLLRRTYMQASKLIGVAPYLKVLLPMPCNWAFVPETAITVLPDLAPRASANDGILRLLFVGRVIPTKGIYYVIRSIAQLAGLTNVHLDIVGEGTDLDACKAEAVRLGIGSLVSFHGWKPRDELHNFYCRADIFVFPSYREPSGNVVFEAMSYGLPLIVADYGGPANIVRDTFGIRIPVDSEAVFTQTIADAISALARAPDLRIAMGRAARNAAVRDHMWPSRYEFFLELYKEVVNQTAP